MSIDIYWYVKLFSQTPWSSNVDWFDFLTQDGVTSKEALIQSKAPSSYHCIPVTICTFYLILFGSQCPMPTAPRNDELSWVKRLFVNVTGSISGMTL